MRGELDPGEPHPAAYEALHWVRARQSQLSMFMEALSSCAIEGNRAAEIQAETARRLLAGEPVSDRYLLGLVFSMMQAGLDG